LEGETDSMRTKLSDLENASFKHAQKMSETLEEELARFERVLSAFEKHLELATADFKSSHEVGSSDEKMWKKQFEA